MARFKVLTHRMIDVAAWLAVGSAVLFAAYDGSAIVAHLGTLVEWR